MAAVWPPSDKTGPLDAKPIADAAGTGSRGCPVPRNLGHGAGECVLADLQRNGAKTGLEGAREITLRGEASLRGDLSHRRRSLGWISEVVLRQLQPPAEDIETGRLARLGEDPGEMTFADTHGRGNLGRAELWIAQAVLDIASCRGKVSGVGAA